MSILDKPKILALAVGKGVRNVKRKSYSGMTSLTGFSTYVPDQLEIAPRDLRTADPSLVQEFYNGRYHIADRGLETAGKELFQVQLDDDAMVAALHSFGWLRHLSISSDALAGNFARALVKDWLENQGSAKSDIVWNIETVSYRLIYWLCHSIVITSGAEHEFYRQFMRQIGAHIRYLRRHVGNVADGMPRLMANIALGYAFVCQPLKNKVLQGSLSRLGQELDRQILADGVHISRNPAALVEILALLLPLREGCKTRDIVPPEELIRAIDRMIPALRMFRMGDGNLARFNGSGVIEHDLIVTILRYDENSSEPLSEASTSGFQRMAMGKSILLMDVGEAPRGEVSTKACASCMAFEFSHSSDCLIVNCGTPSPSFQGETQVWRSSAAHSTVVLNNTSSAKFESGKTIGRLIKGEIFSANLNVNAVREDNLDEITIVASHEGYIREFGAKHQRILQLCDDGNVLRGQERFTGPNDEQMRYTIRDAAVVHFHLHPDVKASPNVDGQGCIIEARSGERWFLSSPGFEVKLEESIFFARLAGPCPIWQINISANVCKTPEINWTLQRLDS